MAKEPIPTPAENADEPVIQPLKLLSTDKETVRRRKAFLINLVYVAFWIAVIILCARYLLQWMMPFVLGILLAALLQRPLKWLARKTRISKKIFSVVAVVLVVLLIAGAVGLICWQIIAWLNNFLSNTESATVLTDLVGNAVNGLKQIIAGISNMVPADMLDSLNQALDAISKGLTTLISNAASHLGSVAVGGANFLVAFIIWIIASVFLTIDYDKVKRFFSRQIPEHRKPLFRATRELCSGTIYNMGKAYGLLMLITFVELSATLLILQIPYAIPVAAVIALIDILPVLGTGTVLIPWIVYCFLVNDLYMAIGLLIAYVIITVIRNILEPKIVGKQIGLNPLVTLFFMYLGLSSTGLFGMFVFPIIALILQQLQEQGHIRLWK